MGNWRANSTPPFREYEAGGVVMGRKLAAEGMKRMSSGVRRKRMEQKLAGSGIAGNDHFQHALKVLLGLLVAPVRSPWRQRLEAKDPVRQNVATIAACVLGAVLQEDWLDLGLEEVEAKLRGLRGTRSRLFSLRSRVTQFFCCGI